ncbi:hypothetical protein PFISCL1PPCAC_18822, partial [Pristionchus fissidentatus]
CERQCCKNKRGFEIHVLDNLGTEVLRVTREFQCCAMYPCCASPGSYCSHMIVVESPPGHKIGTVHQDVSCCNPRFVLNDAGGQTVLMIEGDCCAMMCACCSDQRF